MGVFRAILDSQKAGRFPIVALVRPDGTVPGKCPKCRVPIRYSPVVSGQLAFKCAVCGEQATWQ